MGAGTLQTKLELLLTANSTDLKKELSGVQGHLDNIGKSSDDTSAKIQ